MENMQEHNGAGMIKFAGIEDNNGLKPYNQKEDIGELPDNMHIIRSHYIMTPKGFDITDIKIPVIRSNDKYLAVYDNREFEVCEREVVNRIYN